jgi:hypothetical protein
MISGYPCRPAFDRLSLTAGCLVGALIVASALGGCGGGGGDGAAAEEADPPEVVIGERLFLETRFAQYFAANFGGAVNVPLVVGDPVMDTITTTTGTLPGPFADRSMNCRQCHFVDDAAGIPGGKSLAYDDFARRSPIPARNDGLTTTPRNSPPLVKSR